MVHPSPAFDPTWPYPLTKAQIAALDDVLYEALVDGGCDGTLRRTEAFLEARELRIPSVTRWLRKRGGYCDCEVYLNVTRTMSTW